MWHDPEVPNRLALWVASHASTAWVVFAWFLGVLALLWAIIVLPPHFIDEHLRDPGQREVATNALRTTLAGIVGGLAIITGAIVGALTFQETRRQNRATLELQHRGQVTDRFTQAINQLGSDKPAVRIGAVYALEQIARDSHDLQWPIVEILAAFVRQYAQPRPGDQVVDPQAGGSPYPTQPTAVPADVQASLTVIGRRETQYDEKGHSLYLPNVDLRGAQLRGAHLEHAILNGAVLEYADLRDARLQGAVLSNAQLDGAALVGAHLERAELRAAHMKKATLVRAHLQEAILSAAHLQAADLTAAQLRGASLIGAQLQGANLNNADLADADLVDVNLDGASVLGARFIGADLRGASLDRVDLTRADAERSMLTATGSSAVASE